MPYDHTMGTKKMPDIDRYLTPRLFAAAQFVKKGSTVADIGTDHAYIPLWLLSRGVCEKAYAMDINNGPLLRAKANIQKFGFEDCIQTRLSDGLSALSADEADTVVICGMGGVLINRILERGIHLKNTVKHYILQPMTAVEETRIFLAEHGFCIENECLAKEEDKIYNILSVVPGEMKLERTVDCYIGKKLLENRDPLLSTYLSGRIYELEKAILSMQEARSNEVLKKRSFFIELKADMEAIREVCKTW